VSRLDPGQVENRIDQLQQRSRRRLDLAQVGCGLAIAPIQRFLLHHFAVTDDGTERGAQLMADVRQKPAFGLIGADRFVASRRQVLGAYGNEVFELPGMCLQLPCIIFGAGFGLRRPLAHQDGDGACQSEDDQGDERPEQHAVDILIPEPISEALALQALQRVEYADPFKHFILDRQDGIHQGVARRLRFAVEYEFDDTALHAPAVLRELHHVSE
jgi:hypothetical protein